MCLAVTHVPYSKSAGLIVPCFKELVKRGFGVSGYECDGTFVTPFMNYRVPRSGWLFAKKRKRGLYWGQSITTVVCNCDTRKTHTEFMTEFCVECGRIWINELTGGFRSTERFFRVQKPMDGVWIGHTFIRDRRLASALERTK